MRLIIIIPSGTPNPNPNPKTVLTINASRIKKDKKHSVRVEIQVEFASGCEQCRYIDSGSIFRDLCKRRLTLQHEISHLPNCLTSDAGFLLVSFVNERRIVRCGKSKYICTLLVRICCITCLKRSTPTGQDI